MALERITGFLQRTIPSSGIDDYRAQHARLKAEKKRAYMGRDISNSTVPIGGTGPSNSDIADIAWQDEIGELRSTPMIGPILPRPHDYVLDTTTGDVNHDDAIRNMPIGGVDDVTDPDEAVRRLRLDLETAGGTPRRSRASDPSKDRWTSFKNRLQKTAESAGVWSPVDTTQEPISAPWPIHTSRPVRAPEPVQVTAPVHIGEVVRPLEIAAAHAPAPRPEPVHLYDWDAGRTAVVVGSTESTPAIRVAPAVPAKSRVHEEPIRREAGRVHTRRPVEQLEREVIYQQRAPNVIEFPLAQLEQRIRASAPSDATEEEIRRAVRKFSKEAINASRRKGPQLDVMTSRNLYMDILDRAGTPPSSQAGEPPEEVKEIMQDLASHLQQKKIKKWDDAVRKSEIGQVADIIYAKFGHGYRKQMRGLTKRHARRELFDLVVNGYHSAQELAARIKQEETAARAA